MAEAKAPLRNYKGGPVGLGDPDDRSLRRVEHEVLIPKVMREKAKIEKCTAEVAEFEKCCKASSIAMVYTCRKQTETMKACLTHWYQDETFRNECTEIYLAERSEFRRTGVGKKEKADREKYMHIHKKMENM